MMVKLNTFLQNERIIEYGIVPFILVIIIGDNVNEGTIIIVRAVQMIK